MKFSTRARYGLRFLTYLAVREGSGYIQLKEAAENEKISIKYLEQIVRLLKPTCILQVSRGARGGYALARKPNKISLFEVVSALEGSLNAIECLDHGQCEMKTHCATMEMWQDLSEIISDYFKKKKLSDLVLLYKDKQQKLMYHI